MHYLHKLLFIYNGFYVKTMKLSSIYRPVDVKPHYFLFLENMRQQSYDYTVGT